MKVAISGPCLPGLSDCLAEGGRRRGGDSGSRGLRPRSILRIRSLGSMRLTVVDMSCSRVIRPSGESSLLFRDKVDSDDSSRPARKIPDVRSSQVAVVHGEHRSGAQGSTTPGSDTLLRAADDPETVPVRSM